MVAVVVCSGGGGGVLVVAVLLERRDRLSATSDGTAPRWAMAEREGETPQRTVHLRRGGFVFVPTRGWTASWQSVGVHPRCCCRVGAGPAGETVALIADPLAIHKT